MGNQFGVVEKEYCNKITRLIFVLVDECLDASNGLWKTDLSWSRNASELRRSVTDSKDKTLFNRAKNDIQHLRIVDKQVICVDLQIKINDFNLTIIVSVTL